MSDLIKAIEEKLWSSSSRFKNLENTLSPIEANVLSYDDEFHVATVRYCDQITGNVVVSEDVEIASDSSIIGGSLKEGDRVILIFNGGAPFPMISSKINMDPPALVGGGQSSSLLGGL